MRDRRDTPWAAVPKYVSLARQGGSFARAYRQMARHPIDVEEAKRQVGADMEARERRFLESLDQLVWPYPASPTRRLLERAGADPDDVRSLVAERGLEAALAFLRDEGVYVSYEESLGREPARRGSTTFEFAPDQFANPRQRPDFLLSTSGTSSQGTPAQSSFAYLRRHALAHTLRYELWGVRGAPTVLWRPVLPGGGLDGVIKHTCGGNRPEVWFSQVKLNLSGTARHKRLANRGLVVASRLTRGGIPRPRYAPTSDPEPVIDWLLQALERRGVAVGTGYASSWAHLGVVAAERGISLRGAVLNLSGEPVTAGKVAAVEACGARAVNSYGSVPEGTVAISCPETNRAEHLHVLEHDHAVLMRSRTASGGAEVDALCWTSLSPLAPRVLVNVENDDAGAIERGQPCDCLLGRLGMTTRLSQPRGLSKFSAGGTTMPGGLLLHIVEVMLPREIGGGPTDYQFVERERDGRTDVAVRVDPRLGGVDEHQVVSVVREALQTTEPGALSNGVWADSLAVVREPVVTARSGKLLALQRLPQTQKEPV